MQQQDNTTQQGSNDVVSNSNSNTRGSHPWLNSYVREHREPKRCRITKRKENCTHTCIRSNMDGGSTQLQRHEQSGLRRLTPESAQSLTWLRRRRGLATSTPTAPVRRRRRSGTADGDRCDLASTTATAPGSPTTE